MNYVKKLDMILISLAEELNISETMYDRAVQSYTALGDYIKKHNDEWDVEIYPQGSFAIGTVVKPISDEDQYDVDLVIVIKSPSFDARKLREEIVDLLESYGKYEDKIEHKKRCVRIQYSSSSQFHMDIACAKPDDSYNSEVILIAQDNDFEFDFCLSNPIGYIEWFKDCMRYPKILKSFVNESATEVKPLPLVKIHTPLQQAIQLLKRHRDIYFEDNLDNRPSSILITTLCALSYDFVVKNNFRSESVYETIRAMLENFDRFIIQESDGYHLDNPVLKDNENFIASWKEDPNLKSNFDAWISKARNDIIIDPINFIESSPKTLNESLKKSFGEKTSERALHNYGVLMGNINEVGAIKIDKNQMSSTFGGEGNNIVQPKSNTFFGD